MHGLKNFKNKNILDKKNRHQQLIITYIIKTSEIFLTFDKTSNFHAAAYSNEDTRIQQKFLRRDANRIDKSETRSTFFRESVR